MDLECCQQNKTCHLLFVFALRSLSKWLKALYSCIVKTLKMSKDETGNDKKNYESKKELNLQK